MYLNTLIFPRVDKRDDPDKKISRYSALEGRQQRLQIRRGMEFTTPTRRPASTSSHPSSTSAASSSSATQFSLRRRTQNINQVEPPKEGNLEYVEDPDILPGDSRDWHTPTREDVFGSPRPNFSPAYTPSDYSWWAATGCSAGNGDKFDPCGRSCVSLSEVSLALL